MDLPASDYFWESEECLPSEVEKQASEQLERDLQARGFERQMSVTLAISRVICKAGMLQLLFRSCTRTGKVNPAVLDHANVR